MGDTATPATPTTSVDPLSTAPVPPSPASTVLPAPVADAPARKMTDIAVTPVTRAAQQFHTGPASPKAGVIDLRRAAMPPVPPAPVSAPQPPQAPVAVSVAPSANESPDTAPAEAAPVPVPPVAEAASTTSLLSNPPKKEERLAKAASVPQSDLIKKFHPTSASAASDQPATVVPSLPTMPQPVAEVPMPPVAVQPTTPLDTKIEEVSVPTPPTPGTSVMPNSVATALDSMQQLIPTPAPEGQSLPSTQKAPALGWMPKMANAAAVLAITAIMGGYIWMHNYPAMAVKMAAGKAGIEASVPGYLPSGYRLAGSVDFTPGRISITYSSPGGREKFQLAQQRTSWDSASLLDYYVSRKTNDYLAVQSQGLTIYLYNGNNASWINRGIWYTLEGDNHLNREQIVKIADSL